MKTTANTLKINKSLLMKWAWKLYRKNKGNSDEQFSLCLKTAWSIIKVYDFEKIYNRYYAGLLNYVNLKVRNSMEVEEVVNDTFLKINENYILFDANKGNIGSWLYGIADNSIIDLYRKNEKYNANISISEYTDDNGKEIIQVADELTAEEVIERNETTETIKNIINTVLTEKQRKVAILHFLNDYSYEQVMNELKISMADVKATIRRTRIALQNAIAKTELSY